MTKNYIEFKKERDFGLILGDTFSFLRNEFKSYLKALFSTAGTALVVLLMALAFYTYIAGDMFSLDFLQPSFGMVSPIKFLLSFALYFVAAITAYVLTISCTLNYIKSYIENKGTVKFDEIKKNTYQSFWPFLGLSILKALTIFFATLLCVLPVFYAMVPMAVVFAIFVFEPKTSATEAYSKSFSLVNVDFWTAFGSFLVLLIIYYVLSLVFAMPATIYSLVKSGVTSGAIDPSDLNSFNDPIYILLNIISAIAQFLMNLILVIGGAFIYFHLNEKKNFTGTYERIGSIGDDTNS